MSAQELSDFLLEYPEDTIEFVDRDDPRVALLVAQQEKTYSQEDSAILAAYEEMEYKKARFEEPSSLLSYDTPSSTSTSTSSSYPSTGTQEESQELVDLSESTQDTVINTQTYSQAYGDEVTPVEEFVPPPPPPAPMGPPVLPPRKRIPKKPLNVINAPTVFDPVRNRFVIDLTQE